MPFAKRHSRRRSGNRPLPVDNIPGLNIRPDSTLLSVRPNRVESKKTPDLVWAGPVITAGEDRALADHPLHRTNGSSFPRKKDELSSGASEKTGYNNCSK